MRWGLWLAVVLLGCGLQKKELVWEVAQGRPSKDSDEPRLYIAPTKTVGDGEGLFGEEIRLSGPYKISVRAPVPATDPKPMLLRSLRTEHQGKTVTHHDPSAQPLEAERGGGGSDPSVVWNTIWVPLDGLEWAEGSEVVVRAEAKVPGEDWQRIEWTFKAVKHERSYSGCQRYQMH